MRQTLSDNPSSSAHVTGDDVGLSRALDRITGLRAIPGNRVEYLSDSPSVLAAMARLVERASRSLHFENYIIRNDATGQQFADLLISAAKRGVTVRVMYDALGCRRTLRSYWKRLEEGGVALRAFNRIHLLHPARSLVRNHRKYVAADGARAVLGGVCIGNEWAGNATKHIPPWEDSGVDIEGPAVTALEQSFARMWSEGDESFAAPEGPGNVGSVSVWVVEGIPRKLRVYRAISLLAAAATERIWISDAYLMAPAPLVANLISAARDGVDVRLLVPGKTDVPAVRALTRIGYRELLRAGIRVWEWTGPMLHGKTVMIDHAWFKVGSSNLNPSSLLSNHELDVIVGGDVAQSGATQFIRNLGNAVEIVLRPARVPSRVAKHLPSAVVASQKMTLTNAKTGRRGGAGSVAGAPPLSRRAVMTLRQVTGGLLRSLFGAFVLVALGIGALFIALPRLMSYIVAAVSLGLAGAAVWSYVGRRKHSQP